MAWSTSSIGKPGERAFNFYEAILKQFDTSRLELYGLIFAGEFVCWAAMHFLGGENGRHLLKSAERFGREPLKNFTIQDRRGIRSLRSALRIVGIGREPEAKSGRVALAPARIEAHKPGRFAKEQHQHTGSERIECAKVPNLSEANEMAHGVYDVVRCLALWLVDHERAIERRWLWLAGHWRVSSYP